MQGSGLLADVALATSGSQRSIDLRGFDVEVALDGHQGRITRGARYALRVLGPFSFESRTQSASRDGLPVYLDGGLRAYEGMLHIVETATGTITGWSSQDADVRLELEDGGFLSVRLPCGAVHPGAPIAFVDTARTPPEPEGGLRLMGSLPFRMQPSPTAAVAFTYSLGERERESDLSGGVVATNGALSLVRIRTLEVALEGWVPSRAIEPSAAGNAGMGGLGLRGFSLGTSFRPDPDAQWIDAWLEPGTEVFEDERSTRPVVTVAERVHVVLLHRRGAPRAAIHTLVTDDTPCDGMIESGLARCSERAARASTEILTLGEGLEDSTGTSGRHRFFVTLPAADAPAPLH